MLKKRSQTSHRPKDSHRNIHSSFPSFSISFSSTYFFINSFNTVAGIFFSALQSVLNLKYSFSLMVNVICIFLFLLYFTLCLLSQESLYQQGLSPHLYLSHLIAREKSMHLNYPANPAEPLL